MIPSDWTDEDVLARTIYGEARGENTIGREAVAWVIRNRLESPATWWRRGVYRSDAGPIPDDTYRAVCLRLFQFSCWNKTDPNYDLLHDVPDTHPILRDCREVARNVMGGEVIDPTGGACHYVTQQLWARQGKPAWLAKMKPIKTIGNHVFLEEA